MKKLVESDYLIQTPSVHDKRSTKVKLSDKGLKLCQLVDELYNKNITDLQRLGMEKTTLAQTNDNLMKLERYWSEYMNTVFKPAAY